MDAVVPAMVVKAVAVVVVPSVAVVPVVVVPTQTQLNMALIPK